MHLAYRRCSMHGDTTVNRQEYARHLASIEQWHAAVAVTERLVDA